MTQKNVQRRWANTQIELSNLLRSDISGPKGFDSQRQALEYVRGLFVKYNDLLKKFDDIYETLLHPQKRLMLRLLLDGIVGRLVELKQELILWDSCEYTYFEDIALDQNKTLVRRGVRCCAFNRCFPRMTLPLKSLAISLTTVERPSNIAIELFSTFSIACTQPKPMR